MSLVVEFIMYFQGYTELILIILELLILLMINILELLESLLSNHSRIITSIND